MHLFLGQPCLCCCVFDKVFITEIHWTKTNEKVLHTNDEIIINNEKDFHLSEASDDHLTVGSGHTGERN